MSVRLWMSPDPMTVDPGTPLREARQLLGRQGIRHLPVVNAAGQLAGIISDRDVRLDDAALEAVAARGRVSSEEGEGVAVGDVMSTSVHTIGPDESVQAAARLMLSRRVSALPVVDDDQALLGIITSTDCLLASLAPAETAG
jgi:acetoin utilization protein AcuB